MTLTLECRAEDMRGLDLLFKLQGQTIDTTSILTLTKPQGKLQGQTIDTTFVLTLTKPQGKLQGKPLIQHLYLP